MNRFDVREDGGARARKAGQAKEGCTYLINDADGFLEIGDTRPSERILLIFSGSYFVKIQLKFSAPNPNL